MNTTKIEGAMMGLAKQLADATGEHRYNVVKLEVNVNGQKEWSLYTPSAGWMCADSFELALAKIGSKAAVAEKLRQQAAKMLAEAEAMMKGE